MTTNKQRSYLDVVDTAIRILEFEDATRTVEGLKELRIFVAKALKTERIVKEKIDDWNQERISERNPVWLGQMLKEILGEI